MNLRFALLISMLLIAFFPPAGKQSANAQLLKGIGAIGGSSTDEYEFTPTTILGDRTSARTWTEQLASTVGLNFGSFTSVSRASPRYKGYEYNWANGGDTATGDRPGRDLPAQLSGLLEQVRSEDVTLVYIGLGANDFGISDNIGQFNAIHDGVLSDEQLTAFIESFAYEIESAVDEVMAAGDVEIVLSNIYEIGDVPILGDMSNEDGRARVADAVLRANRRIQAIADDRQIPVVDEFGFSKLSLGDEFSIGGIQIDLRGVGRDPTNFFADSAHRGTLIQGLYANAFIEAINRAYDAGVSPMSDQEILATAERASLVDLDFDESSQTYIDVGRFVHYATKQLGDINDDGLLNSSDIDTLSECLLIGCDNPRRDVNGDGLEDSDDQRFLITEVFLTYFGDSNLDGQFNSGDLVEVFGAGEYEDAIEGNSGWAEGDWNGDSEFDSSDLVVAFADGGYEQGPRVNAVPEPSSAVLLLLSLFALLRQRK